MSSQIGYLDAAWTREKPMIAGPARFLPSLLLAYAAWMASPTAAETRHGVALPDKPDR